MIKAKIPTTTKPRTLLDCAAVLPYEGFELLLQNAVTSGLVSVESMLAIADRRGGRGVGGTVATRAALEGGLVDEKIEKKLELIVARIIDSAHVPKPTRQHPLVCADGRQVFLDNAWADRKIAIEADGRRWHGNKVQAAKTRARARSIVATGWHLYTYGWSEATETPDATRDEIEQIVLGPFGYPMTG
jgi:very-short-patch-repair endonuclease